MSKTIVYNLKIVTIPTTITGNTKHLVRNVSTGLIEEQTIVSGGGSVTIVKTALTYTSSTIFTIPQNKQIISVVVGEVRHLSASKYTYTPALATNNLEITDATFLAEIEAGTTIEVTTI
jgi:hypothetical protein